MQKTQRAKRILSFLESAKSIDVINITPKNAMLINEVIDLISYQIPLPIAEYTYHDDSLSGVVISEICPACKGFISRKYQVYCDQCGQTLKWTSIKKLKEVSRNQDTSVKDSR